VLGANGFVGSEVVQRIRNRNEPVVAVPAPRLVTRARTVSALRADADGHDDVVQELATRLGGCDVVVNAAGAAAPDSSATDGLFGANALLPVLVARAAERAGCRRFVHVSSQSVQGDVHRLTEAADWHPFSPYSESKALGEMATGESTDRHCDTVNFRALSVQGAGRATTQKLVAFARSPLAMVSVDGPTPLTLIVNTAEAIVFCGAFEGDVPGIVLQQGDGLTTREALTLLGARRVRTVPRAIARPAVAAVRAAGRIDKRFLGAARRAELLLFGQPYDAAWMRAQQFRPVAGREAWIALGVQAAETGQRDRR
jgi:nucleoside-diphosphate-sugar epimerase